MRRLILKTGLLVTCTFAFVLLVSISGNACKALEGIDIEYMKDLEIEIKNIENGVTVKITSNKQYLAKIIQQNIAGCLDESLLNLSKYTRKIDVFYKEKAPSLKTLARAKEVLKKYERKYAIKYFLIADPENSELIENYQLPATHFPFAVVINGIYSARIGAETVLFVEFPKFMAGIGRHEGNWSIINLEMVLEDNSLLLEENVIPEEWEEEGIDETDHQCE